MSFSKNGACARIHASVPSVVSLPHKSWSSTRVFNLENVGHHLKSFWRVSGLGDCNEKKVIIVNLTFFVYLLNIPGTTI